MWMEQISVISFVFHPELAFPLLSWLNWFINHHKAGVYPNEPERYPHPEHGILILRKKNLEKIQKIEAGVEDELYRSRSKKKAQKRRRRKSQKLLKVTY